MKLGIQKASPRGRVLPEAMRLGGERSQDTVLNDTRDGGQTIMVVIKKCWALTLNER